MTSGAAGSTGQVGSAGVIFGSWDNGVTTAPQFEGTPATTTTTTPPPAEPVYTPVAMSCFTSAAGQSSYDTNNTGATVFAPRSVAAGADFVVEITPDPVQVPTSGGGYSIGSLTNLKVSLAVPAGATFVSATLSGGSNLGQRHADGEPVRRQGDPDRPGSVGPGEHGDPSQARHHLHGDRRTGHADREQVRRNLVQQPGAHASPSR